MKAPTSRLPLWSACFGNLFEHYDTALFGCLSPFLAPIFFPKQDPLTALLLTYAMIPLGMLARPLGSFVFGMIGERSGRAHALFLTLAGMGIVSASLSFCPTYAEAGLFAPIFLLLVRFLQNFFAGGEISGGAIFLLEHTDEKRHDLLSSIYNASTIAGILLASAAVSMLCMAGDVDGFWRLLYLGGGVTALFGCFLRNRPFPATPTMPREPLLSLWEHRKALLAIALVSGFSYATYSVALIIPNGLIPLISSYSKEQMSHLNTALLILDFATLPLFGWLSSKISRDKLMLTAALGTVLFAIPLFLLLKEASMVTIIGVRTIFVLLGVAFCAPFYAWAQRLLPPQGRCLVISLGYALGSQLFGGPTATLSLWLFKATNMVWSAALYWMALAVASAVVIALAAKKAAKTAHSS